MDEAATRTRKQRTEALRAEALRIGFDAFGVAPVAVPLRREYYLRWIAEGRHGTMDWMTGNLARRLDPRRILPEARSIVALGMNYHAPDPPGRGRVARYARGLDYHPLVMRRLKVLCTWLRGQGGANKPYVDTGPVLEKPLAAAAGLGWQGKSTIVLNGEHGTWLFLGIILTTVDLEPSGEARDRCGTCTRCLDACPTRAFPAPYQLDARRCLAYLSIEHAGPIPEEFRRPMGDRVFGCDDCLDVCPWNRFARHTRQARFAPRPTPDLAASLGWDEAAFDACFQGSAVQRLGLARWKRNVAVVLGNIGTPADLPALDAAALDPDPLVAEHAAWGAAELRARLASAG